jgi:hypothetical protein
MINMHDAIQQTRYHSIKLPKVEIFACTKKDIKVTFKPNVFAWVSFGGISKKFSFDSRCRHRPNIKGQVITKLSVTRQNESYLCLYPIRKELYSEQAIQGFREEVLPFMNLWLNKILERSETEIVGHESLIIEWYNGNHLFHKLTFL